MTRHSQGRALTPGSKKGPEVPKALVPLSHPGFVTKEGKQGRQGYVGLPLTHRITVDRSQMMLLSLHWPITKTGLMMPATGFGDRTVESSD